MPKTIPSAELWRQEGTGAFTSWNDILELGKRTDGSFRLRVIRKGIDDPGTSSLYCSSPFRTPEQLLRHLRHLHQSPCRYGPPDLDVPRLSLSEIVSALGEVAEFDGTFAAGALRALAADLRKDSVNWSDDNET